jgi:hypothetical protein
MHSPSGSNNPAADMTVKRLLAVSTVLSLAMMLSACGGYVADRWPHWAGGLPPDAPPRPGAPGYDDFIAHGEPPAQNAPAADADAGPATSGATGTVAPPNAAASAPQAKPPAKGRNANVQIGRLQPAPARAKAESEAAASAEPVETPAADDPSVVKGGLY